MTFDRRNSLAKLPAITNYLREFGGYKQDDRILHDDVKLAIEKMCGTDNRTERRYVKLLIRHDYLKPTNTKSSNILHSEKYVTVKTKGGTFTRTYKIEMGYKFYRFGSRAPRSHQERLVPALPHSPRSDEIQSENNMCVSQSFGDSVDRTFEEAMEGMEDKIEEKKEEEVVLHTHVSGQSRKFQHSMYATLYPQRRAHKLANTIILAELEERILETTSKKRNGDVQER